MASFAVLALLHPAARLEWGSFTVHWSTAVGLLALAGLYEWRARVEAGGGRVETSSALRPTQRANFLAGLALVFLSLNGWLHDLSDFYLFSAHMVQHLVLTMVAIPLMLLGTPGWMLRPLLRLPAVGPLARWLTHPIRCFAVWNLVVVAWHLPLFYNQAMAVHELHIVQHLMFMAAATLMWWPVLSPLPELPRASYPLQMLYLFLLTIPMSIVAVYIVYAQRVLYPAYASAPRLWGLTPLEDQMIGGLTMWIPGGLYFFAIISVIFFRWQARGAPDSAAGAQATA